MNPTLRHDMQNFKDLDPLFVSQMKNSPYADDILLSTNNLNAAGDKYEKPRSRVSSGDFRLRK